jgi:tetratricopeptide (TPR) repeat protein
VGDLKAAALVDDLLARRDLAPEVRSEAHSHRSFMSHWLGDGSACLFHAREALRWLAASRQQSPIREVAVLGGLGNALMMQANGAEALSYFEQAAKLLTHSALADSPVAQQFAGTYAHALQEMGELRRSIAVAEKGLELEGRAQQEWLPSPYLKGYCGHALALMGRYDEALVVFEQSLASARELGLRGLVYTVRMLIAEMWIEQGLTQDGERESCQAEAEFGEAPEGASGQAARLRVRALLASSYGQVQASLALYEQYVGDDTLSAGAVDGWLGQSAARLRLGDLEAAEADVRRALEVSRQLQGRLPASFRTGHALLQLARVEAARHQNEAAARSASMALVHLLKMLHPQHPALTEAAAMLELHPQPPGGGVAAGNT